jgi:hypothetical protein
MSSFSRSTWNRFDFLVDPQAIDYPFAYTIEDQPVLSPYMDDSLAAAATR